MKKYKVIYADPPWAIGSIVLNKGKWNSPLSDKYPTMDLSDIKKIPIHLISDKDCSLFLWTTHTALPWALEVIRDWGFKYYCIITWDKGGGFSQHGFHKRTEMCLYAYKGKINLNQRGKYIPTLISEKKTIHSRKPKIMREYLLSNSPTPRIELFAREKNIGFDVWGNEVESDISLDKIQAD